MTRKFKIVDWTHSHEWLVEVTGADGSVSPILELPRQRNGSTPCWRNRIYQAARLLEEKGIEGLRNPHAMTGEICRCGDCFCCAALHVLKQVQS